MQEILSGDEVGLGEEHAMEELGRVMLSLDQTRAAAWRSEVNGGRWTNGLVRWGKLGGARAGYEVDLGRSRGEW